MKVLKPLQNAPLLRCPLPRRNWSQVDWVRRAACPSHSRSAF